MQIPSSRHVTGRVLCTKYFNHTEYFNYGIQHSPLQRFSPTTGRRTRSERQTGTVMRVSVLSSLWDVFSVAFRACQEVVTIWFGPEVQGAWWPLKSPYRQDTAHGRSEVLPEAITLHRPKVPSCWREAVI